MSKLTAKKQIVIDFLAFRVNRVGIVCKLHTFVRIAQIVKRNTNGTNVVAPTMHLD